MSRGANTRFSVHCTATGLPIPASEETRTLATPFFLNADSNSVAYYVAADKHPSKTVVKSHLLCQLS
jgi:hypothetical protein